MMRSIFLLLPLLVTGMLNAQSRNLDIYWIDVEGGAATLIVSPSGESMLIDTGFETNDNRDAKRIYAAAEQAGLKKIDYLVISHYHADHVGGLAALSKMIPIGRFFGRGDEIEAVNQKWSGKTPRRREAEFTLRRRGTEGSCRTRKSGNGRDAAYFRQVQVPQSGRSRLGKRDGSAPPA